MKNFEVRRVHRFHYKMTAQLAARTLRHKGYMARVVLSPQKVLKHNRKNEWTVLQGTRRKKK